MIILNQLRLRKNQAKENIKEYVTEHFPEQYQTCLAALDTTIKHAFHILETSDDNREKISALELFKSTHLKKLELLSNAITIESALRWIRYKQIHGITEEEAEEWGWEWQLQLQQPDYRKIDTGLVS
jgi:hypothetical protein